MRATLAGVDVDLALSLSEGWLPPLGAKKLLISGMFIFFQYLFGLDGAFFKLSKLEQLEANNK